jgi:hypothetical protein
MTPAVAITASTAIELPRRLECKRHRDGSVNTAYAVDRHVLDEQLRFDELGHRGDGRPLARFVLWLDRSRKGTGGRTSCRPLSSSGLDPPQTELN